MKKLLFGLLPLLLAGCVNSTNILEQENVATDHQAIEQFKTTRDQWIGKNIETKIQSDGKPTAINKGRRGNFYTWKQYQATGDGFFTTFVETICEDVYQTDDNGIITEWMTKDCYY